MGKERCERSWQGSRPEKSRLATLRRQRKSRVPLPIASVVSNQLLTNCFILPIALSFSLLDTRVFYDCDFFERRSFLLSIRLLIASLDLILPLDSTPRLLS
jgi:hypothetical protein